MLKMRCFKCGWAWSLNHAEVGRLLTVAHEEGMTKHVMIECPQCRRGNKVAIKQMRRYAPPDWKPPKPAKKSTAKKKEATAEKE